MTDFEQIVYQKQGAIAHIRLNRPDAANGLNHAMALELRQAAEDCAADPAIKAVVLGAEGRFFCAGGDVKEMQSHGEKIEPAIETLAGNLHASIAALCRMDAALIIAVNGIAAGGGFSLALIGDIVLAGRSASFTMAYTRAGLCPDGSSSYFLPRLVGLRKAQELMLTNNTLNASDALELGLVTRVVDDDALSDEAGRIAAEFAVASRGSTASVKKLLLSSFDNSLETQMDIEARLLSACAASADGREGIQAFVDKREPKFN